MRCDMGWLIVDEADIPKNARTTWGLVDVQVVLWGCQGILGAGSGEWFQLPDCECPGPDPEPTGYSDMVANQATKRVGL